MAEEQQEEKKKGITERDIALRFSYQKWLREQLEGVIPRAEYNELIGASVLSRKLAPLAPGAHRRGTYLTAPSITEALRAMLYPEYGAIRQYASFFGFPAHFLLARKISQLLPHQFAAGRKLESVMRALVRAQEPPPGIHILKPVKTASGLPTIIPDVLVLPHEGTPIIAEFLLAAGPFEKLPPKVRRHVLMQLSAYAYYFQKSFGTTPIAAVLTLPEEVEGRRTTELIDEISAALQEGREEEGVAKLAPLAQLLYSSVVNFEFQLVQPEMLYTAKQLERIALRLQPLLEHVEDKPLLDEMLRAINVASGGLFPAPTGWKNLQEWAQQYGVRDIHSVEGRERLVRLLYRYRRELSSKTPIESFFPELMEGFLKSTHELHELYQQAEAEGKISGENIDERAKSFFEYLVNRYAPLWPVAKEIAGKHEAYARALGREVQEQLRLQDYVRMQPTAQLEYAMRVAPRQEEDFWREYMRAGEVPYVASFAAWLRDFLANFSEETKLQIFQQFMEDDKFTEELIQQFATNHPNCARILRDKRAAIHQVRSYFDVSQMLLKTASNYVVPAKWLLSAGMGKGPTPETILMYEKGEKFVKRLKAQAFALRQRLMPTEMTPRGPVPWQEVTSPIQLGEESPLPLSGVKITAALFPNEPYAQGVGAVDPAQLRYFSQRRTVDVEHKAPLENIMQWRGKYIAPNTRIYFVENGPYIETHQSTYYIRDIILSVGVTESKGGQTEAVYRYKLLIDEIYDLQGQLYPANITAKGFPTKSILSPLRPGMVPLTEEGERAAFYAQAKPFYLLLPSMWAAHPEEFVKKFPELEGVHTWSEAGRILWNITPEFLQMAPEEQKRHIRERSQFIYEKVFQEHERAFYFPRVLHRENVEILFRYFTPVDPFTRQPLKPPPGANKEQLWEFVKKHAAASVIKPGGRKHKDQIIVMTKEVGWLVELLGNFGIDWGAEKFSLSPLDAILQYYRNPSLVEQLWKESASEQFEKRQLLQSFLLNTGHIAPKEADTIAFVKAQDVKDLWQQVQKDMPGADEEAIIDEMLRRFQQRAQWQGRTLAWEVQDEYRPVVYTPSFTVMQSYNYQLPSGEQYNALIRHLKDMIREIVGGEKIWRKVEGKSRTAAGRMTQEIHEIALSPKTILHALGVQREGMAAPMAAADLLALPPSGISSSYHKEPVVNVARMPSTPESLRSEVSLYNVMPMGGITPFSENVAVINPYIAWVGNGDNDGDIWYIIGNKDAFYLSRDRKRMTRKVGGDGRVGRFIWEKVPEGSAITQLEPERFYVPRKRGNRITYIPITDAAVIKASQIAQMVGGSGSPFEDRIIGAQIAELRAAGLDELAKVKVMHMHEAANIASTRAAWQTEVGRAYTPLYVYLTSYALILGERGAQKRSLQEMAERLGYMAYRYAQGPGKIPSPFRELVTLLGFGKYALSVQHIAEAGESEVTHAFNYSWLFQTAANMPFMTREHPELEQLELEEFSGEEFLAQALYYGARVRVKEPAPEFKHMRSRPRLPFGSREYVQMFLPPDASRETVTALSQLFSQYRRGDKTLEDFRAAVHQFAEQHGYNMAQWVRSPFGMTSLRWGFEMMRELTSLLTRITGKYLNNPQELYSIAATLETIETASKRTKEMRETYKQILDQPLWKRVEPADLRGAGLGGQYHQLAWMAYDMLSSMPKEIIELGDSAGYQERYHWIRERIAERGFAQTIGLDKETFMRVLEKSDIAESLIKLIRVRHREITSARTLSHSMEALGHVSAKLRMPQFVQYQPKEEMPRLAKAPKWYERLEGEEVEPQRVQRLADTIWRQLTGERLVRDENGAIVARHMSTIPQLWWEGAMEISAWKHLREQMSQHGITIEALRDRERESEDMEVVRTIAYIRSTRAELEQYLSSWESAVAEETIQPTEQRLRDLTQQLTPEGAMHILSQLNPALAHTLVQEALPQAMLSEEEAQQFLFTLTAEEALQFFLRLPEEVQTFLIQELGGAL